MPIMDFFDRGWRMDPAAVAYVTDGETWTYQQAGDSSWRIGRALRDAGLAADAKIAVLAPNSPLAMVCVLGIWRAGYAWVPLNHTYPYDDIENLVDRFDVGVVLFHSSRSDDVARLAARVPAIRLTVCLDRALDHVPTLQTWWSASAQPFTVDQDPDDLVAIMPTGGTTGPSKGVMITHRSIAVAFAHMMLALQYRADDRVVNLAAAPVTHTAGLLSIPVSARGGTVAIIARADPDLLLHAIERFGVTELFLPPTVIYRLLDHPRLATTDLSSLRYLLYGAAPMSVEKLRRALDIIGPVMIGGYGQVEAFAAISYLRPEEHFIDGKIAGDARLSSCGRPYPLIDVRITGANGHPLPNEETGEICVRGDLVMKGYYRDHEQTAATVVDGWLHTGDVGHLDNQGYLHITDRRKDVIISGGFNIYPAEIEQVIWSHPAVLDCAVVGTPDGDWGEAVTAVVELHDGMDVDPDELRRLCRERLDGIRTPKRIDIVTALPRSPNGKVVKRTVRQHYWEGHGRVV